MNAYVAMKRRHQNEINSFPIAFAFGRQQIAAAMKKLGLEPTDTEKVVSIHGNGDILRKTDIPAYLEMMKRHRTEMNEAIAADKSGRGFIFDMFKYELENHDYSWTQDPEDALDALGITYEDLENSDALMNGFKSACGLQ